MASASKQTTAQTLQIAEKLKERFSDVEVYRYNIASIRVRVVDECFRNKSNPERDDLVWPLLEELPDDVQADITILLLLAPEERNRSLLNSEFENPTPSRL